MGQKVTSHYGSQQLQYKNTEECEGHQYYNTNKTGAVNVI